VRNEPRSLLPDLSFNPIFLPPPPERCRVMRNGSYGQFITHCLCCFLSLRGKALHTLHLLQHEGPSHRRQFSTIFSSMSPSRGLQLFTNCPKMGLYHGVKLFTTCPRVGPFHRVQSFRMLHLGSPMGSQAVPANFLHHGLLSPWVRRAWQEPAPARGSPWDHSFLQASTCSSVEPFPRATGGYLLHRGPPWTAGEQPASPWSSS